MGIRAYRRREPYILPNQFIYQLVWSTQTFTTGLKLRILILELFHTTWPYFFDGMFENASLVGPDIANHTQVIRVSRAQNQSLYVVHWVASA